jgi:hypothetical protein
MHLRPVAISTACSYRHADHAPACAMERMGLRAGNMSRIRRNVVNASAAGVWITCIQQPEPLR